MEARELSRCWAEINLGALERNAHVAREQARGAELCAVVKANAYGHGLPEVVKRLERLAHSFGVANVDEARMTAAAAPDAIVLILGPALPDERAAIVHEGFVATVSSYDEAAAFADVARDRSALLNFKIDTGMGRMGCDERAAAEAIRSLKSLRNVRLHSISTHLPAADTDPSFTRNQLERFRKMTDELRVQFAERVLLHVLPSAGILGFAEPPFDVVRAGLILYGISPTPEFQPLFEPVMSFKSRIALVREIPAGASVSYGRTFVAPNAMRVATVSAGYADGFPRALSNRGASMLVRGRRCAVLGRVTMDLTVIDVSHVPDVHVSDEVVMIGKQGEERILASEVAERASTIAWEIFTGIGTRVRRVYL